MAENAASPLPRFRTLFRRLILPAVIPLVAVLLAGMAAAAAETKSGEFPVSPPPFTPGIFPCSSCHAGMEVNTQKRELGDAHGYRASPRP